MIWIAPADTIKTLLFFVLEVSGYSGFSWKAGPGL